MHRRPSPPRALFAFLIATGVLVSLAPRLSTQAALDIAIVNGREAMAHEVLVKFRAPHTAAARNQLRNQIEADRDEQVGGISVARLHSRVFDTDALLAYFRTRGDVEYVEPNYIVRAVVLPNDPRFGNLWGLFNTGQFVGGDIGAPGSDIAADSAWNLSKGSRDNVIGVVDTGIDYRHADLAANVWSAPTAFSVTLGGRVITCAAGTHGINAITKTCDPMDDHFHGTHVSGTIGALGNNGIGVVGVNWVASQIGLKFINANGQGTTADAIDAIEFAIQVKATFSSSANIRVLSNSWGGGGFSQALYDEINKANANGMLFVAAAGNTFPSGSNNDVQPIYPANYSVANVVAVTATDNRDRLASFGNYGAATVHLGAPGVLVLSTVPGGGYQYASGTSMATPHVSGAAALVLSRCQLNTAQLKQTLLSTVDVIQALVLKTVTGGRLNVARALNQCLPSPPLLSSVMPNTGDAGTTVKATFFGANFDPANTTVTIVPADVRVSGVHVIGTTKLTAQLEILAGASLSQKSITVTTRSGTSNAVGFTVTRPALGHMMIVSQRNPELAVNAWNGARHGGDVILHAGCRPDNPDCTWTYRNGMLLSDRNPNLAINAWNGARHGGELRLHQGCVPTNPDCTWTLRNGMFISDRNPSLAINAWNGARHRTVLRLHNACRPDNPDCTWSWKK